MRIHVGAGLFALAVAAAACGGGGGSSVVPGGAPAGGGGSTSASTTRATMVMTIPAPGKQASRKPLYISPETESFAALAVLATSTETPSPENAQVFPVATPSPCAAASGGGYVCTLTISAPVGTDVFYLAAFATASPGANSIPLSEYESGPVAVSANPSPMSFTLNGVVAKVEVTVASPDPGNTPDTQVFTVASPSAAYALGLTAYDSNNVPILSDPTTQFETPVVLQVSPANAGVGLVLNSQCPAQTSDIRPPRHKAMFGGGPASVTITCAADLSNVTFGYTGTVAYDSNSHIVDTFTIGATQSQVSPSPTPANVVLQSTVQNTQLASEASVDDAFIQSYSGQLLYVVNEYEDSIIGTFDPTTQTVGAQATLNVNGQDGVEAEGFAVTSGGQLWVVDGYNDPPALDCWSSTSGGTAVTSNIVLVGTGGYGDITVDAIAIDSSGNLWYVGTDESEGPDYGNVYAGYFAASPTCAYPTGHTTAQFLLSGDDFDSSTFLVPYGTGVAYQPTSGKVSGAYLLTTSSPSTVGVTNAVFVGSSGGGTATDSAGNLWATNNGEGSPPDIEKLASGAFSQTLELPNDNNPYISPWGLSAFSPNSGTADRLAFPDDGYTSLGIVDNLATTPAPLLVNMNDVYSIWATAYDSNGGAYLLYSDNSNNLQLAHALLTTTWNVPTTTINACGPQSLMSIDQRGASAGPFTITVSGGASATQLTGLENDFIVDPQTESTSMGNMTIKDLGGRTETFSNVSVVGGGC